MKTDLKVIDHIFYKSVSYISRCHVHPSFFWYDNDKDLFSHDACHNYNNPFSMETKLNAPFCPALGPNLLHVLTKISTYKNKSIKSNIF